MNAEAFADLGDDDGVQVGFPAWLARAPSASTWGCLVAEAAEQVAGPGGNPEREAVLVVLAWSQLASPKSVLKVGAAASDGAQRSRKGSGHAAGVRVTA